MDSEFGAILTQSVYVHSATLVSFKARQMKCAYKLLV